MGRYIKKPVVIDAIQLTPDTFEEVDKFIEYKHEIASNKVIIETLEGFMTAELGDWIIKGVKGEYYPCKDEIFRMTYERVD
ncbi:MAG TPA: hypothetical protein P5136_00885 [Methanofastidiosum sp.]|nr:hypothetical protein [Methanofastidiosum sp.]